ncbi:enolase-phosphatase E1-like isoform X2 [Xyrauchen texanus]|uniref:enolase-phosphatase E1-like isoform X2 n=1 Tax=Xyrauchen texanus TaxID=154827 RepID=UPI0022422A27|nr:enolase-phosphatase E1-like isoform X2 [Xyrauchen texanus]
MTSYLWIFVLGSLIVSGVRMQEEDALDDAENDEAAADDLAPADEEESTIPDEANTAAEDLPQHSDDTSVSEADGEEAASDVEPIAESPEEPAPDPEPEDTNTEPEAASDVEPIAESPEEPAPAEEEPAEEEEAPADTDDASDGDVTVDPQVDASEVTEAAPEEPAGEEEEEPAQEEPTEDEGDAPEGPAETDSSDVPEEPIEDSETAVRGFDLSEAIADLDEEAQPEEDLAENTFGDADRQSAGDSVPGKARSAGAVSDPSDRGSGTVVGIVCGIAVAAIGAITGYFTYQKKKLCFKVQRGDPESAKEENSTQSDPQVLSNLLTSS